MATTKLWHISGRLQDVIDYAENPDKTCPIPDLGISGMPQDMCSVQLPPQTEPMLLPSTAPERLPCSR